MSPFCKAALPALAVALVGCALPADEEPAEPAGAAEATSDDAARDEEAILNLAGQYIAAYNAGDAEALADMFTLRAVCMPPGEPGFSGRSRVQQDFERLFEASEGEITINVEYTTVRGDLAYARGTYAANLQPKGSGDEVHEVGKWVYVLEREPGGPWRISTQIWNRDDS